MTTTRLALLSTAAVALMLTGAAAQTSRNEPSRDRTPGQVERIPDTNRQKEQAAQPQNAGPTQNATPPAQNNSAQQDDKQQPAQSGQRRQNAQQPAQSGQRQQNAQQPAQTGQRRQNNAATPNQSTGTAQRDSTAPAQSGQATQQQPAQSGQQQQPAQSGQQQQTGQQRETAQQPAQSRSGTQAQQPAQSTTGNAQQRTSGVISLNAQQQTRIGATIARHNVRPVTNVNFSISVGTRVPRSVTLRALPADLVTFVPQYRGYSYFVVEEQIVIVEPSTHEIVTVVPYTSKTVRTETRKTTARSEKAMTSRSVSLSNEQRDTIRQHAVRKPSTTRGSSTTHKRYVPGDVVERSITIESFPETVYEEVPVVRRYRYFTDDDDVILVDPDEDRVVEVLR